jgi:hypothetical protein
MERDQSLHTYPHLLALRNCKDRVLCGYRFEQIIREILPWDVRPPLALTGRHEQIDAFFVWNNIHFLVECKAKRQIKVGSHDWEDFELKVRSRDGSVVGLFCSLFALPDALYSAAEILNRQNLITIVIGGDIWEGLAKHGISLSDYLRYMLLHAKAKYLARPASLTDVRNWHYDRTTSAKRISNVLAPHSAYFLRRYKAPPA